MKTCNTCVHSRRDWLLGWNYAKCYHPNNYHINPVTGKHSYNRTYCSVERIYGYSKCGIEGKLWEKK